jgi:TfoX/Sxy family transcriptional regulator of competence genes
MPYSVEIEAGIDAVARRWKNLGKKRMFGGICYLHNGNMCFGIYRDFLIVRAGREAAEKILAAGNARPFDITGKAMAGWVMVDRKGWEDPGSLKDWLNRGKGFAATLPPKSGEKT